MQGATKSAALAAQAAAGLSGTILTGPMGLAKPATDAPKSLLGG